MLRVLSFAVVLVACDKPAPQKPVEGPSKCAVVADHLLEIMPGNKEQTERADGMRRAFLARCRDDKWSEQAQDCFIKAATIREVSDACGSTLTEEQTRAFGAAVMQEIEGKGTEPARAESPPAADPPRPE